MRIVWQLENRSHLGSPDEIGLEDSFTEGSVRQVMVNKYERDPAARRKCLAHHGYRCGVCEIDLIRVYGEIAQDLIHVHHLRPMAQRKAEYTIDPITELLPVCPNCHMIIHADPELSVSRIRELVERTGWLARVKDQCA